MVTAMALVQMALGRYRGFAKRQVIALAPLTVILGRNNSGKSALVRAPLILSTGILTAASEPLNLDPLGEEMIDSFTDLVNGSRVHRGSIEVELEVGTQLGAIRVTATVLHLSDHHTEVVESLELSVGGSNICQLEWELDDPPKHPLTYTVAAGDEAWTRVPIAFHGLLPRRPENWPGVPPEVSRAVHDATVAFFGAFPAVRYLGPFRERPRRRYRLPGRWTSEVGITGENTAGILADDQLRREGRLLDQVNTYVKDHLPGWRVDVVPEGGMRSVVLVSTRDDSIRVNLADTGTGVAQMLPILVQRALDDVTPPNRPVLEIIEQPELHLHPAAHADLAELFLAAVRKRKSTQFLIETHSETFLLRLRRHIAQGLDPATVAVYFVEQEDGVSSARRINIDESGNLDYWPEGVFAEDFEETRELARAQRTRRAADAG
ncbi:Protein of unknown function [Micromonospora purpureochromogenes]|uniref:DUF3696 domain-containing protein n=2 Tax=Micromonospora purpureochromogenes TaxID=47872 RepID=A0A1C4Z703_9ACTN|nr:Protein of unknown function [Micromonospora purpureochromogenes]